MEDAGKVVGIIIILLVGCGAAILTIIFTGVLGGQTYELTEDRIAEIGDTAVTGEGFTAVNASTVTLAHEDVHEGTLVITNVSDSEDIALTNFVIDYDAGTLMLKTVALNNSEMTADYHYGLIAIQSSVRGSILSAFTSLGTTADYLPIVILAVIITVVMSLVMSFASFGGVKGGGTGGAL